MKTVARSLLILFWIAVPLTHAAWAAEPAETISAERPLTLKDCYDLALKQSEEIAVRQELIAETQGRFIQALSGVLPRVSFSSVDKRQDGTGGSQFTLRTVPDRRFVFSQPLFAGFKEFAAMAATKAEKRQRTHEKARAEQLLMVDVSDAFYLLLEQQEDLRALETTHQALLERIRELKERERIGRSRSSEVVSAQAQLHRVEAEMELIRGRETIARHLLEFLTGRPRIRALRDPDPGLPAAEKEEVYLARAVRRPDVQAAQEAVEASKQEVRVAKAEMWPNVNLEGNYFVERVGVSKEVDWDASLKVDVPIFQGGQTAGAVREAASKNRQVMLRFSETRRRAMQEVRDAYADLEAALSRNSALERALRATEESYRYNVEEYRLNLVSNLDLLEELQVLQEARRDLIHAHYEAKRLYWLLKATAGEPTEGMG